MKIVINGQPIEASPDKTILEIARENNIYIPSLCHHPLLQPFAGCRLCLVEIKGRRGFVPACATYPEENMEITTESAKLTKIRRNILELILTEHPSACLICQEKENCDEFKSTIRKVDEVTGCVLCPNNGRCELQEVVEYIGLKKIHYPSVYRNKEIKRTDPFLERNNNLCILCGRCVRVCQEVRGNGVLTFIARGPETVVGTVLDKKLLEAGCQFCGACVDVCPTGALEEKGRKYELLPEKEIEGHCGLCGVGCALIYEIRNNRLIGVRPKIDSFNQGQSCVRGRFVLREIINSPQRIDTPYRRCGRQLEKTAWEEILTEVGERLSKYKGEEIVCLVHPGLSLENIYAFWRFARDVLKTQAIYSPTAYSTLVTWSALGLENSPGVLDNLQDFEEIVVLGTELATSHPVYWVKMIQARHQEATLHVVDFLPSQGKRWLKLQASLTPGNEFNFLAEVTIQLLLAKRAKESLEEEEEQLLSQLEAGSYRARLTPEEKTEAQQMARSLIRSVRRLFLVGERLGSGGSRKELLKLIWNLALISGAKIVVLPLDSNSWGELEVAQSLGLQLQPFTHLQNLIDQKKIKVVITNSGLVWPRSFKPELCIVLNTHWSELAQKADFVLPTTSFLEEEGFFINGSGRVQYFPCVLPSRGEARPEWIILTAIAEKMNKDFGWTRLSSLRKELRQSIKSLTGISFRKITQGEIFTLKKGENPLHLLKINPPKGQNINLTSSDKELKLILSPSPDEYRSFPLAKSSQGLARIRSPRWIYLSQDELTSLQLSEGEEVTVVSSWGKIKAVVKSRPNFPARTAWMEFSWGEAREFNPAIWFWQTDSFIMPIKIKRGR